MRNCRQILQAVVTAMLGWLCLATASSAQNETPTAELVINTRGHTGGVSHIEMTGDGSRVVTIGEDRSIRVWDVATKQSVDQYWLPQGAHVHSTALSPDGQHFAIGLSYRAQEVGKTRSAYTYKIAIVNINTRSLLTFLNIPSGTTIRFINDNELVAVQNAVVGADIIANNNTANCNIHIIKHPFTKVDRTFSIQVKADRLMQVNTKLLEPVNDQSLYLHCQAIVKNEPTSKIFSSVHSEDIYELSCKNGAILRKMQSTIPQSYKGYVLRGGAFLPEYTAAYYAESVRIIANDPTFKNTTVYRAHILGALNQGKINPKFDAGAGKTKPKLDGEFEIGKVLLLNKRELIIPWSYSSNDKNFWGLSKVAADTGIVTVVLKRTGLLGEAPRVAIDKSGQSAAIAFDKVQGLETISLVDPEKTVCLSEPQKVRYELKWSTDGRQLAVVGDRSDTAAFHLEKLAVMPKDGATKFQGRLTSAENSSLSTTATRIWNLTFGDTQVRFLHGFFESQYHATLSSNGKYAFFAKFGSIGVIDSSEKTRSYPANVRATHYCNPLSGSARLHGILDLAPSPDDRFLIVHASNGVAHISQPDIVRTALSKVDSARYLAPLLNVFFSGNDWICWTNQGYYAASPGGEKLMGWTVNNGPDQLSAFHPAERFRASLYRPDIVRSVLEFGSVEKAVEVANKRAGIKKVIADIAEVLPPKVRIQTPSDPVVLLTSTGKLEIEAIAEPSPSNPVEALQLMVENRPYQGDKGLVRSGVSKMGKFTGRWNLELTQPGNYHIYVRAEGKLSNGASNVILVNYTPKSPSLAVRSRLHLLNIGVDDYPGDLKLKCAVNDARGIQTSLEKFAGPLYEIHSHSLLNGEATRGRILDKLALFQKDAAADDLVIVYYAGHGFRGSDKQFYLQPFAGRTDEAVKTCLSAKELRDAIVNIRSRKVVMIVDACHGGAPGELVRELADEGCGAGVLCAAADNEKAGERGQHGFFTLALMEALEGKSLPPLAKDRRVLLSDIPSYVVRRVRELSDERQNPVCLVTGQFALTRP